jgi:hypothetical protein
MLVIKARREIVDIVWSPFAENDQGRWRRGRGNHRFAAQHRVSLKTPFISMS